MRLSDAILLWNESADPEEGPVVYVVEYCIEGGACELELPAACVAAADREGDAVRARAQGVDVHGVVGAVALGAAVHLGAADVLRLHDQRATDWSCSHEY